MQKNIILLRFPLVKKNYIKQYILFLFFYLRIYSLYLHIINLHLLSPFISVIQLHK